MAIPNIHTMRVKDPETGIMYDAAYQLISSVAITQQDHFKEALVSEGYSEPEAQEVAVIFKSLKDQGLV